MFEIGPYTDRLETVELQSAARETSRVKSSSPPPPSPLLRLPPTHQHPQFSELTPASVTIHDEPQHHSLYSFGQGEATNTSLQRYSYRDFCLNDASLWKVGEHHVLLPIRAIRLKTNYANGLGIGKVEYKGSETTFAWRKSGKTFRKNTPSSPERDSNLDRPVLGSLAQQETSALANYATKGVKELFLIIAPAFAWKESGKPLGKNHPQCIQPGSNTNLPIFGSLVYHKSSALDYSVTEAGLSNTSCSDHLRIIRKLVTLVSPGLRQGRSWVNHWESRFCKSFNYTSR
uniref:Uncharacterized protein n=1 Tax=Timema bartmani TaxID=61472 RepID=A0A7R9EZ42_9NEOP|nr:unnamed protein product [Timema bartmani]